VVVTVNPTPVMADPGDPEICSGATTVINFTTPITGVAVDFNWTAELTSGNITGFSDGAGNSIAQLLVNHENSPGVVTYTVIPSIGTCNGAPVIVEVTVNPAPAALELTGSSICASAPNTGIITSSTSVAGVSYQLKDASDGDVGTPVAGTGSALTWNNLAAAGGYYAVSIGAAPTLCTSTSSTVSITEVANPAALLLTGSSICASAPNTGIITSSTSVAGVSYQLKDASDADVGTPVAGTGSALTWNNLAAAGGYYAVSIGAAPTLCTSSSSTVSVTEVANPAAPVIDAITQPTCSLTTGSVTLSGLPVGDWTINPGNIMGNGTTTTISGLISSDTYNFTVTNSAGCTSLISADIVIWKYICAEDDTYGPINGISGNSNVGNALIENDLLNGLAINLTDITVAIDNAATPVNPGDPVPALDPLTGIVSVPAGTPAGTYIIDYTICEFAHPTNCDQASITVTVEFSQIIADDDDASATPVSGYDGGTAVSNVLDNDMLNGVAVVPSEVVISIVSDPADGVTLNTATGEVTVDAGTAAGTYYITYKICEVLNTDNCDEALVTVVVSAPEIIAEDDSYGSINGYTGNPNIGNAFTENDLLNGIIVDISKITATIDTPATPVHPGDPVPVLDPLTGIVSVPTGTPGGTYTIDYHICENLNPLNCDPARITVVVDAYSDLTITKTSNPDAYISGQPVTWTITVTNAGPNDVVDASVNDDLNSALTGATWTAAVNGSATVVNTSGSGDLVNELVTIPAGSGNSVVYTVTASVPLTFTGDLVNTATITPPTGITDPNPDDNTATTTTPWDYKPGISMTKTGTLNQSLVAPDSRPDAGDQIRYVFSVTNTGNTELTGIMITDANPDVLMTGSAITLAPGQTDNTTFTGIYTLTQADIDGGTFTNSGQVSGTPPVGPDVTGSDDDTQNFTRLPELTTVKTTSGTTYSTIGEELHYSITVTNSGNVTVSNISLTDPGAVVTCGASAYTLLPGESFTCTAVHAITLADLDAGKFDNIATATGTNPDGEPVTDDSDKVTVIGNQTSALSIVKMVHQSTYSSVGELVIYSIQVTNIGNISVSNIIPEDANADLACGSAPYHLKPGESFTCSAVHSVTQADLDAGQIFNSATVSGTGANGDPTGDTSNTVTTFAVQNPLLTVTKMALSPDFSAVDEIVNYSITVTNSGNITIHGITVTDLNAVLACAESSYTLEPGESFSCTASHIVTLADLNRGRIDNIASASGTDINGDIFESDPSTEVTVMAKFNPGWTLTKTSTTTPNTYTAVGDLLTYSLVLSNTGNTAISGVVVSDPLADAGSIAYVSGDDGTREILEIGESWMYTAAHTVTQADLDAGSFTNVATATGIPTGGTLDPTTGTETVVATLTPSWKLTKTSTTVPNSYGQAGDLLTYAITITNTGNVAITGVMVTDPQADAGSIRYVSGDAGIPGTLEVGETWIYTAAHTATPADLNAGKFTNTATATGTSVGGILPPATDKETIYAIAANLSITKTGQPNPVIAGENITYTITVHNQGTADAQNVVVTDLMPDGLTFIRATMTSGSWTAPEWTIGTLANGATATLTLVARVNDGVLNPVINTATVTSTTHDPDTDDNTSTDETTVVIVLHPELTLTKTAIDTVYGAVGDLIHYNLDVMNTGEVTLHNVTVTDPNAEITSGIPIPILPPGMGAMVSAIHTITQADIDAGQVLNAAIASGTGADGDPITDTSNIVVVSGTQRPQITATKFVSENTYWTVGEILHYTIEVFNCGNVTVSNILTNDPNATITEGSPIITLAPRHTVTVNAIHVVTQADLDLGKIVNTASIHGTDPLGKPVTDDSNEVTIYAKQSSKMIISETALENGFRAVGDTLHYTVDIKNPGNMTLWNILVTNDNAQTTGTNAFEKLTSGQTVTVTAIHRVTQADLDAGKVVTFAVATALNPDDTRFFLKGNEVTLFAQQSPDLAITKTAAETSYSQTGDLIHYTNEIRNTGNVRITGITLTDPNTSISGSNQIAALDPGQKVIIQSVHTITQADLNIGFVEKTASISGKDPNSQSIRFNSNKLIVKGSQLSGVSASLSAAETSFRQEGETLHYTIEIRNTGNITLSNVSVTDANATFTNGSFVDYLLPGRLATLSAEHPVSASDLASGKVVNIVQVTGHTPAGESLTVISNELVITANSGKGVTLTKVAQESGYSKSGDLVHYTLTLKNNGNGPVSGITLSDPNALIMGNPLIAGLPVGESAVLTAVHTVTQADLDAGWIENTATAEGKYADGSGFAQQSNPVTVYAHRTPQITASLSALETTYLSTGDQIHYSIEVKNTGNLTLSGIKLEDLGSLIPGSSPVENLEPGKTVRLSAVYSVVTSDIEAGVVVKTLRVTGQDPDHQPVNTPTNPVTVTGTQNPELLTFAKAEETNFSEVGEVIHYTILVKNSGNVSIISTAVTDPNAVIITVRPITILMPGDSVWVHATHLVTQSDLDAGKIVSVASAAGFDLSGKTIEKAGNTVTVFAIQRAEINLSTTASKSLFRNIGETIEYATQVKNLGNITLFNLKVTDPDALVQGSAPLTTLRPGDATTVWTTRTISQGDLDAGEVVNVSKASGESLLGKPLEKTGNTITVKGVQHPELTTSTETSVSTYKKEGDQVVYTVNVKNTGNVTMHGIFVTDAKELLEFSRNITQLAPGESGIVSAIHAVTLEDINAGKIVTAGIAHGYLLNEQQLRYMSKDVTVRLFIENYNLTNFPNPFAYQTTIVFDLPEKGEVILKVYDLAGKEVADLDKHEYNQGRNYVNWTTKSTQKGIYIIKLYYNGDQAIHMISVVN